jgi:hypothetical protein
MASKAIVALLLLVAACHRSPTAPAPDIVGTITSRVPVVNAPMPQMLVQGDPASCGYIVYLWKVRRIWFASGASADTSALAVGAQVRIWTDGTALTSCPAQVAAIDIQIDRPAS